MLREKAAPVERHRVDHRASASCASLASHRAPRATNEGTINSHRARATDLNLSSENKSSEDTRISDYASHRAYLPAANKTQSQKQHAAQRLRTLLIDLGPCCAVRACRSHSLCCISQTWQRSAPLLLSALLDPQTVKVACSHAVLSVALPASDALSRWMACRTRVDGNRLQPCPDRRGPLHFGASSASALGKPGQRQGCQTECAATKRHHATPQLSATMSNANARRGSMPRDCGSKVLDPVLCR